MCAPCYMQVLVVSVTHERQCFTTYSLQKCDDTSGSSNTGLKLEVYYTCECVHVVDLFVVNQVLVVSDSSSDETEGAMIETALRISEETALCESKERSDNPKYCIGVSFLL